MEDEFRWKEEKRGEREKKIGKRDGEKKAEGQRGPVLVHCWGRMRDGGNESSEQGNRLRSGHLGILDLWSFGRFPLEFVEHARDIKTSRVIPSGILSRSN